MIKTSYLVGDKFVKVSNSPDPIVTTMDVTEKEINLIKAMREIKSQDNTYEIQILTKSYPGGYTLTEYQDIFEIKESEHYKCRNCGKIIDKEEY